MNTDFRVKVGFHNHPKVVKLIRQVGREALGSLVVLWGFASAYRPDGILTGMDEDDIEIASEWHGDQGAFMNALISSGLIKHNESGFYVHDWAEHNPWAANAKSREEQARKAAETRWGKKHGKCSEHAGSINEHCSSDAVSIDQQCPSPLLPLPKNTNQKNRKNTYGRSDDTTQVDLDKKFDEYWKARPSRTPHSDPKKPAKAAFIAACKRGTDPDDIIEGAKRYKRHTDRHVEDKRHVAQSQTWLRQERWTDEHDTDRPLTLDEQKERYGSIDDSEVPF